MNNKFLIMLSMLLFSGVNCYSQLAFKEYVNPSDGTKYITQISTTSFNVTLTSATIVPIDKNGNILTYRYVANEGIYMMPAGMYVYSPLLGYASPTYKERMEDGIYYRFIGVELSTTQVSALKEVSVSNFPSIYNVSGSTIAVQQISGEVWITSGTVALNDSGLNRVVIRNASPDRNLSVNTYNGIDVRLLNNTGTLISDTNPLPVNYAIMLSSYTESVVSGTIKSGSTYLARVIVGTAGAASSLIIRNGTSDSAPIISTIDTTTIRTVEIGAILGSGLYIEPSGTTAAKLTIIYR